MRLQVLGSAGAEFPGYNPPAFLLDGTVLLDAGTIGAKLPVNKQLLIRDILVTHSHLDHIKGIPFLADNIVITRSANSVTVYGIGETIESLKKNLLNNEIWPDFTKISASIEPVIKFRQVHPGRQFKVGPYSVKAFSVNHTVPAVGYMLRDAEGKTLVYTGDTGPTSAIWKGSGKRDAVIVEVSFPNAMEALALKTGHLTPALLVAEIAKMKVLPERIFITHPKPQYIKQIRKEIALIGMPRIEMLSDGKAYSI